MAKIKVGDLVILKDWSGYERECLDKIKAVANFPDNSDGLFVPGGSMGNMYSIHLARWKKYGDRIKKEGAFGMKPIC